MLSDADRISILEKVAESPPNFSAQAFNAKGQKTSLPKNQAAVYKAKGFKPTAGGGAVKTTNTGMGGVYGKKRSFIPPPVAGAN